MVQDKIKKTKHMIGIFLDTETNGLNPMTNRVLEIAFQLIDVENGHLIDQYESIVFQPKEIFEKSNKESLEVNGFTYDKVLKGKPEQLVALEIKEIFQKRKIQRKNAVFICQNPSFDRAFFSQLILPSEQEKLDLPYHWLDLASMFWSIALKEIQEKKSHSYPWDTGLSKNMIAARFGIPSEQTPHEAMNGVKHLLLCYKAVVGYHKKVN
jgi:DNA polymerase-3 subunit epsilon/oligoribonuclease